MFPIIFVPGMFWNQMSGVSCIHYAVYSIEDSLKVANKSGQNMSPTNIKVFCNQFVIELS